MRTWQNLPYSLPTNHLYSKTGEDSSNKSYICNILQHTCGCTIFSKQVDFNITSDTATLNHCTYVCNSIFVNCDLTLLKTNCNTCRKPLVHMTLYVCGDFAISYRSCATNHFNPHTPFSIHPSSNLSYQLCHYNSLVKECPLQVELGILLSTLTNAFIYFSSSRVPINVLYSK